MLLDDMYHKLFLFLTNKYDAKFPTNRCCMRQRFLCLHETKFGTKQEKKRNKQIRPGCHGPPAYGDGCSSSDRRRLQIFLEQRHGVQLRRATEMDWSAASNGGAMSRSSDLKRRAMRHANGRHADGGRKRMDALMSGKCV